ncbi:MAG: SusC/RagA family TonB-linked outer membrane protein [Prevotellaceae bacterium]|jgi:TonB-linked SusC/RagA family outer membrane protein|nr:SusC/RagA family TonB-linked outer membrane protein [Prevotellaceae bacterium]
MQIKSKKDRLKNRLLQAAAACMLCMIPASVPAQTDGKIVVRGTVTDNAGPLFGVTVSIQGTTNAATTDADGNYTITVTGEEAVLTFSYIGYSAITQPVGTRSRIDVTMEEEVSRLDEVVVIGYGTAKKSDITGAVARADLQVMENASNVNMMQMLKGIVPGLNIGVAVTAGGDPTISIRGRNSISGEQSPLIVLDGIIYRGAFTDINPADIGSIDILKDASSAAIYGSQGANGVLLITTKSTTQNSKPVIHYSGQFSFQSLTNSKLRPLDAEGYVQFLKDCFLEESRTGADLMQYNPAFDVTQKFRDQSAIDNYNGGNIKNTTDWWDLLSNPLPYVQNHSISVNGKNDLASYFVSLGLTDQKNLVANDNYKRYSFRVNLDLKVTDWLKVGTQSYYNISDFSGSNIGFSGLGQVPALVSPYNADGSLKELYYLGNLNPMLSRDNPNEDIRNSLSGTFYADISIPFIKGLSYRANYSYYHTAYHAYSFNPYSNNDNGAASKNNSNGYSTTFDNILTYKRDFGKHSVNATLVYGIEKRTYESTNAGSSYFTDMTLGYNEMQAGQADLNTVSSDAWKETSLYTMARLVYSFNDRYIFTGTIRRDGFSGFTTNNKFAVFPSVALAWRASEESFVKDNVKWIDNLKLRVSYGSGGNRTAGRYSSMAQMATSISGQPGGYLYGDGGTGQLMQYVSTMANNNLKWETTTSLNIGIDFSVFKGRIFGNYEYYYSKTKDLLYNIYVPIINGASNNAIPTNIGKLRNFGHEFSITGVPVQTKDWQWFVTGTFALNNNKVLTIIGQDADGDGKEDDIISSDIFIGEPLGTLYNYNIIGMWQVADYNAGTIPAGFTYGVYKVEDIDNSGNISADNDRKIVGYADPLYSFSIQNTVKYQNLELKMMINSVQGGKDHYLGQPASTIPVRDNLQNWNWMDFDYWTPENPDARYRQLGQYNTVVGVGFSPYVSRSFVRLQEVSLAYNLPKKLLSKLKVANAKVYISGTNLLTLTDWDGWDPEPAMGHGITWGLTDIYGYGGYPMMKSFTVGLNLGF